MNKKLVIALIALAGCASREYDADASKWLIPVNAAGAYFGSVALHEAGHAASADFLGSESIHVDFLPTTDEDGFTHLGLTTFESSDLNKSDLTLINISGPAAQFVGHIGFREMLKTNQIPRILQPTLGWLGLFNQAGFYFHVFSGLARVEHTDLGKEDAWISGAMLACGAAYDIYDLLSEDEPENRFLVLFGEHFYEAEESEVKLISRPLPGGGYFGVEINW